MTKKPKGFQPDRVSPPGDTILDLMQERDWSQAELSQRLGFSTKHLNQLIKGKVPLSDEAALRLERVLGSTASFWLNREARYRERLARTEAQEKYRAWTGWLEQLPLAELKKIDIIPRQRLTDAVKPALVETLLQFFGVASPDQWQQRYGDMQASFRRTRQNQADLGAIAAWLRLGEIKAEKLEARKYNKAKFTQALNQIRELTIQPPQQFVPEMRRLCLQAGVKLVFVPAIPRAHVSGAARWLNRSNPLIQLSLYGKTNDKLWFTFFHEAAHILLHADGKNDIYLDDPNDTSSNSRQEHEADQWASEQLIPPAYRHELATLRAENEIRAFADKINIHPGIVTGRLQHEKKIKYSQLNKLKESFNSFEG